MVNKEATKKNKRLSELVLVAKGSRSMNAYAKAAQISITTLIKIIRGDYIPSAKIIKKLTSVEADPQGGVTCDEMMKVAGYVIREDGDIANDSSVFDGKTHYPIARGNNANSIREQALAFEAECIANVYVALADRGIVFKKRPPDLATGMDLMLDIIDQPIKKWFFEFVFLREKTYPPDFLFRYFGRMLWMQTVEDTKVSIVTNNDIVYQFARRYEHRLNYRGEMSVILYDTAQKKYIEECYLANYVKEDLSREIYLTNL